MNWKKWSTGTKVTAVVIAVLFVTVTVMLAVFIPMGTSDDRGWMGACWSGSTVERYSHGYDDEEPCPELPEWELPITVRSVSSNPHPPVDHQDAVPDLLERMNHRAGVALFEYTTHRDADVMVLVGEPVLVGGSTGVDGEGSGGDAFHTRRPDGSMQCQARTANTGSVELWWLVAEHELWHCLGLAHDRPQTSIMRERQVPTPDRAFPPRLSDQDVERVRDRYGSP